METCKTGALTYETLDAAMKRKTDAVARSVSADDPRPALPPTVALYRSMRQSLKAAGGR